MKVCINSRGIWKKIPKIRAFFPEHNLIKSGDADCYAGWGYKDSAKKAIRLSKTNNKPYWALEDAFIRSYDLGVNGAEPLGVIADSKGVYFDATRPSELEDLIKQDISVAEIERAKKLIAEIVEGKLTKYNHNIESWEKPTSKPCILVIDQCAGDASITHGMASAESFSKMIAAAKSENPNHQIILKVHPDVVAGKRKGYLDLDKHKDCIIISENINPYTIFEQVDKVYVVTSLLGFEAVMAGKKVRCFGAPFYAGWGVTEDGIKIDRRAVSRTVEQIFYAAYIKYSRYINPYKSERCELEDVLEIIKFLKSYYAKRQENLVGYGFSKWKRYFVRPYLKSPSNQVIFIKYYAAAVRLARARKFSFIMWAAKEKASITKQLEGLNVLRMEDGFIRSVGLGSDFYAANSLIFDKTGIHFNHSIPSDLENILNNKIFTAQELERAKKLREMILKYSITKYNTETNQADLKLPKDKKIILAVGQVEGDASIRFGSPEIKTNQALIDQIREDNPDAYIIYKPHPDVVSGNRKGSLSAENADVIVTNVGIHSVVKLADEVHTITSLVGFESLMQDKIVVTYGLPFYSGWGLTIDKIPHSRRTKKRNIDELVAAALIDYPSYYDFEAKLPCTPEVIIQKLANKKPSAQKIRLVSRAIRGIISIFK